MPLISIITTIYNTDKYLKRCIESLINQTYKNIEIILVDDGSEDNSGIICDEYAAIDPRIKVIHQKNTGESVARNTGLDAINGDYVMFCDSDDEYYLNSAEILFNSIKADNMIDLSTGAFLETRRNITRFACTGETPYCRNDLVYKLLCDNSPYGANYILSALQAKIFKVSVIKGNNIRFDESFIVGNDTIFIMDYLKFCNKIVDTFYPMYVYYKYDVEERIQGMSWHYPDIYRLMLIVNQKRFEILDSIGYFSIEKRADILNGFADRLIADLVRGVVFKEYYSNGFKNEIEWAINNEFAQECFEYYKPLRKIDSLLIPKFIKEKNIDAAYNEICNRADEWELKENFHDKYEKIRCIFKR